MSLSKPPSIHEVPAAAREGAPCERFANEAIAGFELGAQLAVGLLSCVYKAKTVTSDSYEDTVAIKLWRSDAGSAWRPVPSELLKLKHVNVVRHIALGATSNGTPYLIEEYVRGQTLESLLRHGPIEVSRAVGISRQLARALAALHGANLVHADLKPNHILIVDDERHEDVVKLCDVGSKSLEWIKSQLDDASWARRKAYFAPEQQQGSVVTPRSDLYSAGAILFEMLTGAVPTEGEPASKLIALLPRYVPRALKDVVFRLLQKEPSLRFSSAEQWLTALDQIDGRDQEEDETFSSAPRSAFITGGLSRTAPPGSVRAATSLRKAPWGLDARGFRWWAVACGLAAGGAATIVGYRMYTHADGSSALTLARNGAHHTVNPQGLTIPSDVIQISASARSADQWITLCTYYAETGDISAATSTLEQAIRHQPSIVRGAAAGILVHRLGDKGARLLQQLEHDDTLSPEVHRWARNNE
jgi:serine/threonine protein kinase